MEEIPSRNEVISTSRPYLKTMELKRLLGKMNAISKIVHFLFQK